MKVLSAVVFMAAFAFLTYIVFEIIGTEYTFDTRNYYESSTFNRDYNRLTDNASEKYFDLIDEEAILNNEDETDLKNASLIRLRQINENLSDASSFMYAFVNNDTGEIITNIQEDNPVAVITKQPTSLLYDYGHVYFPEASKMIDYADHNGYYYYYSNNDFLMSSNLFADEEFGTWSYYTAVNEIISEDDKFFYENSENYKYAKANETFYLISFIFIGLMVLIIGIYWIFVCGKRSKISKAEYSVYDNIPQEIQTTLTAIAFIPLVGYLSTTSGYTRGTVLNNELMIIIVLVEVVIVALILQYMSLIRLFKTGQFFKKLLTYRVVSWGVGSIKLPELNKTYKLKIVLLLSGLWFFNFIGLFILMQVPFLGVILLLVLNGLLLRQIFIVLDELKDIMETIENRVNGQPIDPIKPEALSKYLRQFGRAINSLQHDFDKAVEERFKGEKLKSELITNVTHDLKNPLTSIISYIEVLQGKEFEDSESKKYIDILGEKSNRLKGLIDQLVEASKANSGNMEVNLETIDLIQLSRQLRGEYDEKLADKNLTCVLPILKEPRLVKADRMLIYRILENLMSNVSKYALEGTRVYIDIIEDAEEVNYTIKNISKEPLNINVEDLSKRFVRGDSSRTTEGSGLGLSIALNLATIMGARLDLSIDGDLFKASLKLTKSNEMLPSPLVEETSECDTEEFFIEIEDNL